MSEESLNPERDELWAKHDGLTPACCAEMIALAGKLEQERNVWRHEAEVVRKQLESEHETAISLFIEFHELKNAVAETLEENCHLADGDQCTLKKLKDAYAKAGASLDSENVQDQTREPKTSERCLHPACSALPWLKRPSDLGMWWAFWEGKYSLWQVIKIPAGWMAMNKEIGNSMVGWINSANPENCELEGSIWFPALGGWPNA